MHVLCWLEVLTKCHVIFLASIFYYTSGLSLTNLKEFSRCEQYALGSHYVVVSFMWVCRWVSDEDWGFYLLPLKITA